jgi:hypothetical protein
MVPVGEIETIGEFEVVEAVRISAGDVVDVAIPLRLVTIATFTVVLEGIKVVDDIDKPETVAEMTMPTVEHNFWANMRAPIFLISECALIARTIRQTN